MKICSVVGCEDVVRARGYCKRHYKKWYDYGDPNYTKVLLTDSQRLENRKRAVNLNNLRKRIACLTHYSKGDIPECCCCGEREVKFLSIDHINGGGNKHRKAERISNIFHYLARNGFPEGYQTLCHNCNMAKGFYGSCPHQAVL